MQSPDRLFFKKDASDLVLGAAQYISFAEIKTTTENQANLPSITVTQSKSQKIYIERSEL